MGTAATVLLLSTLDFLFLCVATAQAPVAVTGRVVADSTGDPIVNARVAITTPTGPSVVLTDSNGRFALPSAVKACTVSKSGYGTQQVGIASGDQPVVRLVRGAVITGRIVDEFGEPYAGARVMAEPSSAASNSSAVAVTDSDDRGEYRLGSLAPGRLKVAVVTIGAAAYDPTRRLGPLKSYYPGVPNAPEAQEFALTAGGEQRGIDFVVPARPLQQSVVLIARLAAGSAPPATGTSVIRGQVVTTDGRGVPHAEVNVIPQSRPVEYRSVRTDRDGRFEARDLAPDTYRIMAMKQGYSPEESGSTAPVAVRADETRDRVVAKLRRWGVVSGHVFDELGDPIEGAAVQLLQVRYESGRRRLVPVSLASRPTDDLGQYRVTGAAPPGNYIVSASIGSVPLGSPNSVDVPGYARSYYPGTPNPGDARFVTVDAGSEVPGIDFSLSRTTTARITGTVLNSAGEAGISGSLTLSPSARSGSLTSVAVGARTLPNGQFEFPNVPAGQYIIRTDRGRSNRSTEGEFGTLPVTVNGTDIAGLVLQTSRGSSIKGRITFEAYHGSKPPSPQSVEVSAIPTDPDRAPANVAAADISDDWTFEMRGINGPRRFEVLRTPAEWSLKEIRVRGIDIGDRSLSFGTDRESLNDVEVVLTDRVNVLAGTVTDDRARPADGTVLVFAADRDRRYPNARYFRRQSATADGTFSIAGLPAGSYYVIALTALPVNGDDSWQESAYLDGLVPRATFITLADDRQVSLNLKVIRPPQ